MAITAAAFKGYERIGNTAYRVRVAITDPVKGNYEVWLENITGDTVADLAQSAAAQIAALSTIEARKDLLAGIAIDTAIPIAPTVPIGPTAGQIADAKWVSDVRLLVRVKNAQAAGLASALLTTDLTTLTTSVNTGYTTARAQML